MQSIMEIIDGHRELWDDKHAIRPTQCVLYSPESSRHVVAAERSDERRDKELYGYDRGSGQCCDR
jgi:hypothetical protein